jgi:phospholipid/cholesterol/gamma-HCH transport system permease protein
MNILTGQLTHWGQRFHRGISLLGDWSIFATRTLGWTMRRLPNSQNFLQVCNDIGVRSVGVILITGLFIGMVLAVQMYSSFSQVGLETRIGSIINISIVKELGPVLAATMLAGRVGSAMAAELATMRITEQIDALDVLGANPIHYLVVPRFLACVILIPLLTVLADFIGVLGGAIVTTGIYGVDSHYYWTHARDFVGLWDVGVGLFKSVFFGAVIGLISCHRGFHSRPGAQGVGRAATEAFVASFITILVLDFFLAMFLNSLYKRLWPDVSSSFI